MPLGANVAGNQAGRRISSMLKMNTATISTRLNQMSEYFHIPLDELTKPKGGQCYVIVDHWWTVDPDKGALIFKMNKRHEGSPQCNSDKRIVDRMLESRGRDGYVAMQIPLAFMPHKCEPEYHDDRY